MIAFALAAVLAATSAGAAPQGGSGGEDAPTNASPAASSVSAADLQRWIDAQPEVQAYRQLTMDRGLQPPPADAFRRQPTVARDVACRSSRSAMGAAVRLFHASDEGKITLVTPAVMQGPPAPPDAALSDPQKQLLQERARQYEQAAGEFEPACLG